MNKLHMLALTGLMFSGINNASMMGQEQREVLYTLHTLGQDFANVPMITQNSDMFKGVLEMNIQVNSAKLQDANENIKKTILTGLAIIAGAMVTRAGIAKFVSSINCDLAYRSFVKDMLLSVDCSLAIGSSVFNALNLHDVWKHKSALVEAIALDKEILSKLEEIDTSMDFITENAAE